jgi:type I restriction enzyme M protein
MLESETKRRIDTARDILVGKVPDPKSQVEQITIALIYKFMDDMDRESVEMGGKASFFTGEYKRYRWSKIFDPRLGGHEMLNLYAEAIVKLNQNAGIPQLFRDIFKNAYLPYRDPETLKLFLGTINEFVYDHSENLGDAFEYLLSVLGSQGDAGQFRTPRNIIDFMVAVIDPQKNESIIDPACGTAGFLISSYRHIIKANTKKAPGDLLATSERKKLLGNFRGYDISPDMVRLSLVNLYLHGFSQPKIFEYDTLTSDERWNEYGDVILANPPFMSPKGGIKPHKRFSVQSSRSEVLFVDYIAEHLTPSGRAAVIVPEGIIFQSGTAYKQIRKILVEKYLYAVVSLPAGVFNPYSGVKTSILFFEPLLARKSDSILFVKIENDGFSLGAQRRAIDSNDLPAAAKIIGEFRKKIVNRKKEQPVTLSASTVSHLIVAKEKIAANGDYNLSGERYREGETRETEFVFVELKQICELVRGVVFSKNDEVSEGGFQVLRANNINKDRYELDLSDIKRVSPKTAFSDEKKLQKDDIFICLASGSKDHIGKVALIEKDTDFYFGGFMGAIRTNLSQVLPYYLLRQLTSGHFNDFLREQIAGANINNLSADILYRFQIPLPPIEVQREIVTKIESYQKIIDGARQVVDNWKPHIDVDSEWPMVELDYICTVIQNGYPVEQVDKPGRFKVTRIQTIANGIVDLDKTKWTNNEVPNERFMRKGDILFSHINSIEHLVKTAIYDGSDVPVVHGINLIRFQPDQSKIIPDFLLWSLKEPNFIEKTKSFAQLAVNQASIKLSDIRAMQIPLPPLETQRAIVADIEAEQALVAANRELITRMEKKIQAVIARVWGESSNEVTK